MLGWLALLAGVTLEVVGTVLLRARVLSTAVTFSVAAVCILASLGLFAAALRTVPLGVAYTVWAGLGTAAIVAVDALAFGQPLTFQRLICILLIVSGVIGLNFADPKAG